MSGGFYGEWYALYGVYLTYGEPRAAGAKRVQAQPAGPARRIESAFMRTCRIRGVRRILMGSDTFYNEQALLWEVVRFVQAVTGMRTAPPVRAEKGAGSACRAIWRRSFLWGVVHSIGRRFLWGVIRFE